MKRGFLTSGPGYLGEEEICHDLNEGTLKCDYSKHTNTDTY